MEVFVIWKGDSSSSKREIKQACKQTKTNTVLLHCGKVFKVAFSRRHLWLFAHLPRWVSERRGRSTKLWPCLECASSLCLLYGRVCNLESYAASVGTWPRHWQSDGWPWPDWAQTPGADAHGPGRRPPAPLLTLTIDTGTEWRIPVCNSRRETHNKQ